MGKTLRQLWTERDERYRHGRRRLSPESVAAVRAWRTREAGATGRAALVAEALSWEPPLTLLEP
jgi:hypothetical protein